MSYDAPKDQAAGENRKSKSSGRRGHRGRGSLFQETRTRKDGTTYLRWVAVGPGEMGMRDGEWRRDRGPKGTGRTQAEALRNLERNLERRRSGITADTELASVGSWLDHWLSTIIEPHRSPNTTANYRTVIEEHLKPGLGSIRLADLTPEHVEKLLAHKAAAGLSRSYVSRMKTVLAAALKHAERRRKVTHNAASLAAMPKTAAPEERRALTADEKERFLAAAVGDRLEALIVVGFELGLRPGELTGLLWSDVDIEGTFPTVSVTGSMKRRPDSSLRRGPVKRSRRGVRTIAVPPYVQKTLKVHKARQASEKLNVGEAWADPNLVFATAIGTPLDPSAIRKLFARIGAAAGIEGAFPYIARHTCASLLLNEAGVSVEQVAQLLGDDAQTIYKHYHHPTSSIVTVLTDPRRGLQVVGDGEGPQAAGS